MTSALVTTQCRVLRWKGMFSPGARNLMAAHQQVAALYNLRALQHHSVYTSNCPYAILNKRDIAVRPAKEYALPRDEKPTPSGAPLTPVCLVPQAKNCVRSSNLSRLRAEHERAKSRRSRRGPQADSQLYSCGLGHAHPLDDRLQHRRRLQARRFLRPLSP